MIYDRHIFHLKKHPDLLSRLMANRAMESNVYTWKLCSTARLASIMALSFHNEVDVLVSSPMCVAIVYEQYFTFDNKKNIVIF